MQEQKHIGKTLAIATMLIGVPAVSSAGEMEPFPMQPAAPSSCDGCNEPGWYGTLDLVYLQSYASELDNFDGEWDPGFRASLGHELPDGLFYEVSGFWYEGDFSGDFGGTTDASGQMSIDEDVTVINEVANANLRRDRLARFVDATIGPHVGMTVDQTGCDVLALNVKDLATWRSFQVVADGRDQSVPNE